MDHATDPSPDVDPYRPDVVLAFVSAPLLAVVETFRRWGDLLAAHTVDDYLVAGLLLVSAWLLRRRHPLGQDLWMFTWGCASFMIVFSFLGQFEHRDRPDPSGLPFGAVLAVKGLMMLGTLAMTLRAFRLARRVCFRRHSG